MLYDAAYCFRRPDCPLIVCIKLLAMGRVRSIKRNILMPDPATGQEFLLAFDRRSSFRGFLLLFNDLSQLV